MTTPTYVNQIDTVALLVSVGNGASPEVFSAPALVNTSRGLKASANATAQEIPRTDDPTQPMKTIRVVTSTDTEITGAGTLNRADAQTYFAWLYSGAQKNVTVNVGSATGDMIWAGPMILESFEVTGSKHGDVVTCQLTMKQADVPAVSAHS